MRERTGEQAVALKRDGVPGWGCWTVVYMLCSVEQSVRALSNVCEDKHMSGGAPVVSVRGFSAARGEHGGAGYAFQHQLYAGCGKVNMMPAASRALPGSGTAALASSALANGALTRSMPVSASMRVPAQGGEGRELHSK